MSRATIKGRASAFPAFAAILLACAGASATAPRMADAVDRTLTECTTDSECDALDADTVLIGIECGPDKVTSYAAEEDLFRFDHCDVIERRRVVGLWMVEGSR
ncbi:MAG: hypothetical protein EOP19_20660 [Hyphomicrobiales bacterium]|nr:MAG: hypothetical protein EOP19_20660 [Hyphomicrobiales bacterium]